MKISKIFLILIIGIISLNAIFAGQITQKSYLIKGVLTITDELHTACVNGKDWGQLIASDIIYEQDQMYNLLARNKVFDQLFFAEAASKCDLEIYSPSGTRIRKYANLNAEGIKEGLNTGFIVGPVNDAGTPIHAFTIKIKKQANSATLLETTIKTLNPSTGIGIHADSIRPRSISPTQLYTFDDNMTGKGATVLSWDEPNQIMLWKLIESENVSPDAILWAHLSGPVKGIINSKLDKIIYSATPGNTFTQSDKYLRIPVSEGGTTTMYYLRLSTLNGSPAPSLTIVENSVSLLVGQTAVVDAIIENINTSTITAASSGETYNAFDIGQPNIVTEGGVTKARVSFTCVANTNGMSSLPKITVSGTTASGSTLFDSIDINCYNGANHAPNINITNSGVTMYIGYTYDLTWTQSYISSVTWTASPYQWVTLSDGGTMGKQVSCKAGSDGIDVAITAKGNPQYPGFEPDTDVFTFTCETYPTDNGGQPPGTCFLAGTKVYTINGWKNIENINAGEKVYSYSDDGKLVETNVKSLLIHDYVKAGDKSVKLELSNSKVLFVTSNHAFYSPVEKSYKQLKKFNIGDDLLYYNVTKKEFENVQISKITELPSFSRVYNLTLDAPNNYLAEGIVVHNRDKGGEVIPGGTGGFDYE